MRTGSTHSLRTSFVDGFQGTWDRLDRVGLTVWGRARRLFLWKEDQFRNGTLEAKQVPECDELVRVGGRVAGRVESPGTCPHTTNGNRRVEDRYDPTLLSVGAEGMTVWYELARTIKKLYEWQAVAQPLPKCFFHQMGIMG